MLGSRTNLHIFQEGSVTHICYCTEILLLYARLFRDAMGPQFLFLDDNATSHRTEVVAELLESKDIQQLG